MTDAPTTPPGPFSPQPWLRGLLRRSRRLFAVRWMVFGVSAGVVSGFAAVLFFVTIEALSHFCQARLAGLVLPAPVGESLFAGPPGPYRPWMIPIMTTLVGLLTGLVVTRLIPESLDAGTDGTDALIKAFHRQGGLIRPLTPIIKALASILTISAGGSAGREGPISQLCGGLGSYLAVTFGLSARERRILLLAGAAGGLGAIFRAPLGGALTAVEVIYAEDFEAEALLPSVLSSVTAYTIFTLFFGAEAILEAPNYRFQVAETPFYLLMAFFCAGAAWFYVKTFFFIKFKAFGWIKARLGVTGTMALGGLLMGLLGWAFPELLGGGYGWLELAVKGQFGPFLLLALFFGKTLATSLTLGSGQSGGMFAPALFAGGMAGGFVGHLGHQFFPHLVTQPGGFALVGMAAFFAGIAAAPVGPLIMVCEITQGYGLLAPLMLCSAVCLALCRSFSIYENQVRSKFESPAHLGEATINVLESMTVEEVYCPSRVTILTEETTLAALADIVAGTEALCFPVRGRDGTLQGLVTLHDARRVLFEPALGQLVVVKELSRPLATIKPDVSLYDALLVFLDTDLPQIPVVAREDESRVLGLLDRRDVFSAYSKALGMVRDPD